MGCSDLWIGSFVFRRDVARDYANSEGADLLQSRAFGVLGCGEEVLAEALETCGLEDVLNCRRQIGGQAAFLAAVEELVLALGEDDQIVQRGPARPHEDHEAEAAELGLDELVPACELHVREVDALARQGVDRQMELAERSELDRFARDTRRRGLGERHRGPFQLEFEGVLGARAGLAFDLVTAPPRTELGMATGRGEHRRGQEDLCKAA